MSLLKLALKSVRHRWFSTLATVFSLTLSLLLLFSVERVQRSLKESFTQTVSGVDLIVGARTGSLQLVLYSVFNIGQATNNISYENYQKIAARHEVEWTIPYSLGDGHKGYRVVATDNNFFKHYRYRSQQNIELQEGRTLEGYFDVVLGAEVAKSLNYKIGDKIILVHGSTTGDSFQSHEDKPFTIVGIMKPTGTALDRSLYISLQGMEAIHIDWKTGAAPSPEQVITVDKITSEMVKPQAITSFFLKTKNRIQVLNLQREITNDTGEALLAVIPGVVLSELWQSLSQVEVVLKIISSLVMVVGLIGMMIALLTSLNERRREIAILRSLGAKTSVVAKLIIFEVSFILTFSILVSALMKIVLEFILSDYLKQRFGLFLSTPLFSIADIFIMVVMFGAGLVFSIAPVIAFRYRSLKDGLAVK
ncbi:MAG: ABC transporter permease [Pseudobdellovibrio sp.]